MTEPVFSPLPLDFHARIPCDGTFAPVAAQLAGRLAKVAGFDEARAADIGQEVGDAFATHLGARGSAEGPVDLAMRVTADAFAATVTCGTNPLLCLSWPRPA